MNCQSCGKKLRAISADLDFRNWKRKYHQCGIRTVDRGVGPSVYNNQRVATLQY